MHNFKILSTDKRGICLIANMTAHLEVGQNKYIDLTGGTVKPASKCSDNITQLVVDFDCAVIDIRITRNRQSLMELSVVRVRVKRPFYIDIKNPMRSGFKAREPDHAYRCVSEQTISLRKGSNNKDSVNLVLSRVRFETFRNVTLTHFYQQPDSCDMDIHVSLWSLILIASMMSIIVGTGVVWFWTSLERRTER